MFSGHKKCFSTNHACPMWTRGTAQVAAMRICSSCLATCPPLWGYFWLQQGYFSSNVHLIVADTKLKSEAECLI